MKSSIKFDLADADYRASAGVSNSSLKHIARSPAHYRYEQENPTPQTDAMLIGTLTHLAVFQPDLFHIGVTHCVKPEGMNFSTKDGKAWRDAQTAPVIKFEDAATIDGIVRNVRRHPVVSQLIADGRPEVSMWAEHEETGLMRKCRVDWLMNDRPVFLDGKTIEDATTFERESFNRKYNQQCAYYSDIAKANGIELESFLFIVFEKEAPYGIRVCEFNEEAVEAGRRAYTVGLRVLAQCLASGCFPSYTEATQTVQLPNYLRQP